MVAGGLFNAVAFAGACYLFQKFNKDGYGEEVRRHDLALEKLEKARQEWNQKDIERQEKMVALRQEKKEADADFEKINKRFLRTVGRNERIHDVIHRSNWIGWRMGWSENYL